MKVKVKGCNVLMRFSSECEYITLKGVIDKETFNYLKNFPEGHIEFERETLVVTNPRGEVETHIERADFYPPNYEPKVEIKVLCWLKTLNGEFDKL